MRRARSTLILLTMIVLGWVILSATGRIDKVNYKSFNNEEVQIGEAVSDEISVKDNTTFAVKLPEQITFAGEVVPMHNMDVRERLDRELTVNSYWHSSSILLLKRANRWFPTIERILRENNIPDDFKYLAMAESGLQDVTSHKGATGFWQFMKTAATEQGLTITSEVDERYHVEKATEAACGLLRRHYNHFGSWTMAAAAYNMGQTGLQRQVDRQEQEIYYDLILNPETGRYIFRILAMKAIFSAPRDFGFELTEADMYHSYDYELQTVDHSVKWPEFCAANDITYRELKLLNPWLREAQLTNTTGKEYTVKVMEK